jgi:site-specific DNA recombinase
MSTGNGKPLRFASLIRVSTEEQEKQGASLLAQRHSNERDVTRQGGKIVATYGGQEHATAGFEKVEVDKMLADAGKGKFDAVIVSYPDRWSRDNSKSKEGLDTLRRAGVKFFVGSTEMNLFDPGHTFILGMHAEVGEFIALQQAKKSIEVRIEKAQQGIPTVRPLPFGRTFEKPCQCKDKDKCEHTGVWGIDPGKKSLIDEVARRYLGGEQLPKLATELGISRTTLYRTLREQAGPVWEVEFEDARLNIREKVAMSVPPLLDDDTLKDVKKRLRANATYLHGKSANGNYKRDYLLSGRVFCRGCGCNLFGEVSKGRVYYRHPKLGDCPLRPRPAVPGERLERQVLGELFKTLGNPAAINRAVRDAVPDCEEELKRRDRLRAGVERVEAQRARLIDTIADGLITKEQAKAKLGKIAADERTLRADLEKVNAILASVPSEQEVTAYVERIGESIRLRRRGEEDYPEEERTRLAGGNDLCSWMLAMGMGHPADEDGEPLTDEGQVKAYQERARADQQALVDAVFSLPLADGTPAGVYVFNDGKGTPHRPKEWSFLIRGRLEFESVVQSRGGTRRAAPSSPLAPSSAPC